MSQKVKKAIIPAAGLGTRFLPATKTVPKEMLTIVDAPIILYVVEEAMQAGIEDIVLIQGRGKTAIEDFFDYSYELEDKLAKDNKVHLLDRVRKVRDNVNIISIRQKQPLGLGHAVLCGEPIVGDSPFAVLLGDEIMINSDPSGNTTSRLARVYEQTQGSAVAVMEVAEDQVSKYGIADIEKEVSTQGEGVFKVKGFIEKPAPSEAPSRLALPGRYVLESGIFEYLKSAKPGKLGEIQLTDSMNTMARQKAFYAATFEAKRYDAGDKLGYLMANIELGLKNPELASELKAALKNLVPQL